MKKYKILIVFLIILAALSYYFYFQKVYTVKKVFPNLLDTYFEITLKGKNPVKINSVIGSIYKLAKEYEKTVNYFDKNSELYKVNQKAKYDFIELSDTLYKIIKTGNYYEKISNKKFSILTGEFKPVYSEVLSSKKSPDKNKLNKILNSFKKGSIIFKNKSIKFSNPNISIDLGSIAKGCLIDEIVNFCKSKKMIGGIINAGGDLRVFSTLRHRKWRIGVQEPRDKTKILKIIELYNGSVATSGDYERFVMLGDKRFHHIMNTVTGYPADINISSTVITVSCAGADALTTIFFVMNEKERNEFIANNNLDVQYIVMNEDKKIFERLKK